MNAINSERIFAIKSFCFCIRWQKMCGANTLHKQSREIWSSKLLTIPNNELKYSPKKFILFFSSVIDMFDAPAGIVATWTYPFCNGDFVNIPGDVYDVHIAWPGPKPTPGRRVKWKEKKKNQMDYDKLFKWNFTCIIGKNKYGKSI